MKKVLLCSLALSLLLPLAACGKGTDSSAGTAAGTTASETTAASAEADAENGNDIVTASTVEDSTFEADENIVPGVLYQLGDDEPVIRGVCLEGASSGAEFNGKPASASDIRFIFENTEWIWIGLDTAEDSGLSAFIVKHQDDPATYTESFFANIDENVPKTELVKPDEENNTTWGELNMFNSEWGAGYYDLVFTNDLKPVAKVTLKIYNDTELQSKSDSELAAIVADEK